jgi:hypothetical protein
MAAAGMAASARARTPHWQLTRPPKDGRNCVFGRYKERVSGKLLRLSDRCVMRSNRNHPSSNRMLTARQALSKPESHPRAIEPAIFPFPVLERDLPKCAASSKKQRRTEAFDLLQTTKHRIAPVNQTGGKGLDVCRRSD